MALRGGTAEGGKREVGLSFGDIGVARRHVRGVVEWAHPRQRPADGRWPAPDLALIRLLEPVAHDCVWLTERTRSVFTPGTVAFFGCTEEDGRIERISGRCTILGELGTGGELKLGNQDEIPEGASGGPMVDLEHGEVIGVIKARRTEGRDGGLGLSVLQLRRLPPPGEPLVDERHDTYHRVLQAHDRYHRDRHRDTSQLDESWTDAQTLLPAAARRALTPGQRAELLGMLAELPPPASTRALGGMLTELRGRPFSGSLPAPRGWRDGLGLLYDLGPGRSELETVLRYAVYAATADHPYPAAPGTEDRLLEWAHRTARERVLPPYVRSTLFEEQHARDRARLSLRGAGVPAAVSGAAGPAGIAHPNADASADASAHADAGAHPAATGPTPVDAAGPPPFVLLEITPHAWEPSRYDWLVYAPLPTGDLVPVDADSGATGYDQPPPRLRAALAEAFRRCDEAGRPVMVQAALPYAWLHLPVDEWHVSGEAGARLGEQRPVVVRCTDPDPGERDDEPLRARRLARWKELHAGPMTPLVLDCLSGHPRPLPEVEALAAHDLDALPVLCRTGPDGGQDSTAMYRVMDGGHAMVLWRRGPAAQEPGCGEFHRGVTRTVSDAGRGGALPEALRRLRAEVGGGTPEAYWSDGLALLYSDPGVPLPGADDLLEGL
ncbi:VMAP-C domain-containing protein [Streptomyces sp. 6N223]|uniref:VMAP-C domain-containing protein n=1 Tax=Streptomyces sp. 6N223 TaxID=3457412 RepID=UPI003FCF2DB4